MEVRVSDGARANLGHPHKCWAKREFRSAPLDPHVVSDLVTAEKFALWKGSRYGWRYALGMGPHANLGLPKKCATKRAFRSAPQCPTHIVGFSY